MTDLHPATTEQTTPTATTESASPAEPARSTELMTPAKLDSEPAQERAASVSHHDAPLRTALVVLVGMMVLAVAFIIMIFVNVTSASINALAVIATPIASMVAAYYGITLSFQQVKNERAEKEKAVAKADAADAASRETEVWAAQLESGLRVAMAKLNVARVNTDEVTKAAGTPDDFF